MSSPKYYAEFILEYTDNTKSEKFEGVVKLNMPVDPDDEEGIKSVLFSNFEENNCADTIEDIKIESWSRIH
jgi:hypothetical protein